MCELCSHCGNPNAETYCCEHTNDKHMCKDCYEEIHWLINDNTNENRD